MKNYYKDHDEARVSVSLTMLYTSDNYADWKLENSLVRVSGDSIPPARPSYEKPLAERKKTDITVACGGREFPVHSVVLTRRKSDCFSSEEDYLKHLGIWFYSDSRESSV